MAIDARLDGKPERNDGSLPVMTYDHWELPQTSKNIWHAQKAGWPVILTYDSRAALRWGETESSAARRKRIDQKRRDNLDSVDARNLGRFRLPSNSDIWRDEYPFASTVENAGSTWVGHCDAEEQRTQALLINHFYRHHGAQLYHARYGRPFWFEVKVVNMPQTSRIG